VKTAFRVLYETGLVRRHHCNASDAVQNIGHHSWGVAMVLDYIYPTASKTVILAALRHDMAEMLVGDLPAYTKWNHKDLAALHGNIEQAMMVQLGMDLDLTEHECIALKTADMLELWLWSSYREHMGDEYFKEVRQRVEGWFADHPDHTSLFPIAARILHDR
jgi:5'-deoxynucleotidase YfbR-like HD superfamily hydrolase